EGRCLPHGAALPFHLVVQFLEDTFGIHEGESERSRIEKVERVVRALDPALEWTLSYLKQLLALPAEDDAAGGLDQAQRRRRRMEAVRAFVLRGAEYRPLVLLAEDLQWIDPNSEDLLRSLIGGLASRRILFLGTYRQGYAPPWQDRSYHHRLALEPLDRHEAEGMLAALAASLPEALRRLAGEGPGGKPVFIQALARDRP